MQVDISSIELKHVIQALSEKGSIAIFTPEGMKLQPRLYFSLQFMERYWDRIGRDC